MEWFKFDISAYERDTRDLNALQDGIYSRLLRHYYLYEGALPSDLRLVYQAVRAGHGREKAAVRYVLGRYFVPLNGHYTHPRCDLEIKQYQDRSDAGRIAAAMRWHPDRIPNRICDNDAKERKKETKEVLIDSPTRQTPIPDALKRKCSGLDASGQTCQKYPAFGTVNSDKWFCEDHKF